MEKEGQIKNDRVYGGGLMVGIGCLVILVLLLAINFSKLPPLVPWFYSLPWGEGMLIKKVWLWLVAGMCGVVLGTNMILAATVGKEETLLRRFLIWGGAGVIGIVLLGLIRILLIIV